MHEIKKYQCCLKFQSISGMLPTSQKSSIFLILQVISSKSSNMCEIALFEVIDMWHWGGNSDDNDDDDDINA